ncbi:uncharacterized protein LOC132754087 isoform X2 [Ruditapes philippinarum]|uniref:uncharacterized protein LOC132754087 isoform X2 n=1 Tax=Ruditapes philippinarum TaxID=129788 RepID=UPI00295AD7A4|nr:uncharacterized protein LOC132754087 isoform X2 [Ruditapes philippinarum]
MASLAEFGVKVFRTPIQSPPSLVPSYRFVDSLASPHHGGDGASTSDVDTLYNTANIPARSPLTLRRRNTVAVIVVAIALLAAVAAITGVILHFLHPKAMLRANVRFTIANRNYTDDMRNSSSLDFHELARPLCEEMDVYFLTSELADFYLGCNVVSMTKEKSKMKTGTAVHYTLDFIDNKVTNDGERIKKIIMRKSGRQQTEDTLYLAIRDFLVYLRSLKVGVEVLPLPGDHPGRRHRPRIPWNEDVDFIARLPKSPNFSDIEDMKKILRQLVDNMYNMTTKIDHMQDAINFINKTFHETHRPLFNLEETLGNMTVSLGNLNQNLNSINATMTAFKDFLKQFGNKIFNIDDVIKNIDDTIGNLGKAVSFIEFSMSDINGTMNGISDNVIDMNNTLTYVNRSVLDVNYTAAYSNDTLDSMQQTLISLENAIKNLSFKVNIINNGSDQFDISLKNINDTVKNTHKKLNRLHGKLLKFNSSMTRVAGQAQKLKQTYDKINKTLENMNEPYMFINGTVLEVIEKLSTIDDRLSELYKNMDVAQSNITMMNVSLLASMDWLDEMVQTLTKFNLWMESNDDQLQINLNNKDMIETVGMLLNMNGTLSEIGYDVDHINIRLDKVDLKLENLEEQLLQIDRTLDDIDVKFKLLDKTLKSINATVKDTDVSLKTMNFTIKAIKDIFENSKISFENINSTLDTVNKTLIIINNTAMEINSTVTNVNKTFDGLTSTVKRTTGSAKQLKSSVSEFKGTVRELNTQLYNANESMRITMNKADIATKSYLMLNNTLAEVDKTVSELRNKLNETNGTLLSTDTSLQFVNNSLLAIQNSFHKLRTDLSRIQDSYSKMNASIYGFGDAFPTIQTSIQETQKAMIVLQDDILQLDDELHDNIRKRDLLVNKKAGLNNKLNVILERLDLLQSTIQEITDRSNNTENDIVLMNESVKDSMELYYKTEKNVRYINDTHDIIKELYDYLQHHSVATKKNFSSLGESMKTLKVDFEECRSSFEKYSNVDLNLDTISSEIASEILKYENTKESFDHVKQAFTNTDKVLWSDDGNPSLVHNTFDSVVNETERVNNTVNKFQKVLNETDKSVTDITDFKQDMHLKIKDMYKLKDKIDAIDSTETIVSNEITITDKMINDLHTNITKGKEDLLQKLKYVERMKRNLGNINGTVNSTKSFDNLEKDIRSSLDDVNTAIELLENSSNVFQEEVHGFKIANKTYHKNIYDLSSESQIILNNTLEVMKNTKSQTNDLRVELHNISTYVSNIYDKVNTTSTDIEIFELKLQNQKTKNNFVTSERPLLEEAYQRAFTKLDSITTWQEKLFKDFKTLQNISEVLKKRIDEKQNVNISILEEERQLKTFMDKIIDFKNDLSTSDMYLETFYERFSRFDESSHTLQDIKKEYEQHYHAVEHFETVVKDIPSVQMDIFSKTENISKTFEDLLRQLTELLNLKQPIKNASVSVLEVKTKLDSTWKNVDEAISHHSWLQDEFARIKNNYTNFTATEIDLTESYVIEAIDDIDKLLSNLTFDLQNANESVISLQDTYDTVKRIYTKDIYDRFNIDHTIQQILVPTVQSILEKSGKISSDLDSINLNIRRLEVSIKGVNETIHVTNKQLFIDRQKKLLADTKFPELEFSVKKANDSIMDSLLRLDETKSDLEGIITAYDDLSERLTQYPHFNISLGDLGKRLHIFNESISSLLDELNASTDLLNQLNNTLWDDDGRRYSNNETIDDMKKRYKRVDEMLNKIFGDLSDINSAIATINNGSAELATQLSSLNDTVDSVNNSDKLYVKLYSVFTTMEKDFEDKRVKVNELSKNVSDITESFRSIENRFANINQSVFNKLVNQFNEEQSNIINSVDSLKNLTNHTSNDLSIIRTLFDLVKVFSNKTSNSTKDITESVFEQNQILKNISQLLTNVEKNIDDIGHNSSYVKPSIHQLDNKRVQIEREFRRQEKLDFFEKYFPKNKYDNLNDTIESVKRANSGLESHYKLLDKHFNELRFNLSKHKNIHLDISQIGNSSAIAHAFVVNNSVVLRNISNDYLELKTLLYANDESVVSDAESIDDMRKRYETINNRIDNITSELLSMKDNIGQQNSILEQNAETIVVYQKLISSYENARKNTFEMIQSNKNWNKTFVAIQNLNLERNASFTSVRDIYKSMCTAFNGTTSEAIENLKSKIDKNIKDLLTKLNIMDGSNKAVLNNVSISENVTISYAVELMGDHQNSDLLRKVLLKYEGVASSVNKSTSSLSQMNKTLIENGSIIDNEITALQRNVKNLREMFIRQQKLDYIEENAPILLNLLQKTKNDMKQAELDVDEIKNKTKSLQIQYEMTNNITKNTSSLEIPLIRSIHLMKAAKDSLNKSENILKSESSIIKNIDLNKIKSFYSSNDTLEDIMNFFVDSKKNISKVSKTIDQIIQKKRDLGEEVNGEENYLKELYDETIKLQSLKQAYESTNGELVNEGKQIQIAIRNNSRLAEGKTYLDNRLADIVQSFKNVKEKSLYNDVNMILSDLINLGDGYTLLNKSINSTNDAFVENMNKSDQIYGKLNTISATLYELKEKTTKAYPIRGDISEGLIFIKNRTNEIANVMATNLDMLPKINKSISNLQEKFRKQEIHEYIKENFPSLLKHYDHVNKTLDNLHERIIVVTENLISVHKNSVETIQQLNDSRSIEISFDNISTVIDRGNVSLKNVIFDKNRLESIYKEMENVISNSVGSNETLEDIKRRFAGYEQLLQQISANVTELNTSLSDIDSEMDQVQTTIDIHNAALTNFHVILGDAEETDQSLKKLRETKIPVEDDLNHFEIKADFLKLRLESLSLRFEELNSTLLNNERDNIGHNMIDFVDTLTKTQQQLHEQKDKLEQVSKNNSILKQNLNESITTIDQLKVVSHDATRQISIITDNMQAIKKNIENDIRPKVAPYNKTIESIEDDINNLVNKYLEQEKNDFFESNIPLLMQLYKKVNKSLDETKASLLRSASTNNLMNKTIQDLQEKINAFSNIKITTEHELRQLNLLQENNTNGNSQLNQAMDHFISFNTDIFKRKEWSNISIDRIKDVFDDSMKNISLINSTLNDINSVILVAETAQNKSFDNLNETKSVLDRYHKYLNASAINEEGLQNLSVKLNETHKLLEDVKQRFYNDGDRLFNLMRKYRDVTSTDIKNLIDEIRMIIDETVGLRIPLANKLFSKRIMENYNAVSARFIDVVYDLNDNYTSKDQLKNILGDVDETLMNITLETENMVGDEEFYREDAIRLSEHLNNSNYLLDKLEDMFEVQAKIDLLNKELPDLTDTWNKVNNSLYNMSDNLSLTSVNISDAILFVNGLDDRINQIESVNITTENLYRNFSIQKIDHKNINESAVQLKRNLDTLQMFDIDAIALANNKSITLSYVQKKLTNLNNSLIRLTNESNDLESMYKDLKRAISSTKNDAEVLSNALFKFKDLERDVKSLNRTLHETNDKLNDTEYKLKTAFDEIKFHKNSLKVLKQRYSEYSYDSRDIEVLVNMTEKTIAKLNKTLSKSDIKLSDSKYEFLEITAILYNATDEISVLNNSIENVEKTLPPTFTKVREVDRSLDNITNSIPEIAIVLRDIGDMLRDMNVSLVNENLKSNFADRALPKLKEKYEETNRTFEMTNKTLQRMADEIDMLNEYIETLKFRMNDFSTINISLSDIDANITHLENRLLIMKEHYDNVKGIVNNFRNDISVNNIFGRNISLSDVEDQYKTFNDSLDLINVVLAKIDNEAYEMDEHFEFLNETMAGIDNALDRFETKQMDTKIMEKDIENVAKDLSSTNKSIDSMQDVVNNFSERFDKMNVLYADVLQSTIENNTLVNKLLETTNKSLDDLRSSVTKLGDIYDKVTNGFVDMNETLFGNIDSYVGLNNTLGDVKSKYLKLSKSLTKLEKDINGAKQNANGNNSTLSELSVLLDFINETLYKEKVKFDFIKNNLGHLADKFHAIKSPLEKTNKTLSAVKDNLSNTSNLVQGVKDKLKGFSNIHISVLENANKLKKLESNVSEVNRNLKDIDNQYELLQKNIKNLDNHTGDVMNIKDKYKSINESLDNLQMNLTEMLTDLENVNNDTNSISDQTKQLNSALDKLDGHNNSAISLTKNISNLEGDLETTGSIINQTRSNVNELKSILQDMENVYSSLNDNVLLGNITDLIKRLNASTTALKHVQESHRNISNDATGVIRTLKETKEHLNSDVYNQEMLDSINNQSGNSLNYVKNKTDILHDSQRNIALDADDIQNTIDLITNEILRLNDTLAEEKKKQEFIATNFPHMQKRYENLNKILDNSNNSISETNLRTETVAERLSSVKERLNNITAITIPLNSENNEAIRIKKEVDEVLNSFKNVSKVFDDLNIDNLSNVNTKYEKLKDQYFGFDNKMNDIEKDIKKINNALDDINKTASFINESVNDINSTVDEYIESGDILQNYALSGENLSANIGQTNHSIRKISDEVQALYDTFDNLLQNYSHIKDPVLSQAQNVIMNLLNSSSDNIHKLGKEILNLNADNDKTKSVIQKMNRTHLTTKNLLSELKQHLKDVKNNSSNVNVSLSGIGQIHADINKSVDNLSPNLKNVLDMITNLNNSLVKEQEKIDFIATKKPLIEKKFRDLFGPLEMTNNHLSFTDVKLADLKYEIITTGSRLDKFKTLNFTTDPELQRWNIMNNTVKNISKLFHQLSDKYKELKNFLNTMDDRNISIDEMKLKFNSINSSLNDVEDKLENVNTILSDTENEIRETENIMSGLHTSMDNFKQLQTEAMRTKQNVNDLDTIIGRFENDTNLVRNIGSDIKQQLTDMKTMYAPLNHTEWNKMQPKYYKEASTGLNKLNEVNESVNRQRLKLKSTASNFDNIISEISSKYLTRKDVDSTISEMHTRLNITKQELSKLDQPLRANSQKITLLSATMNKTKNQVDAMNTTLHNELLKHDYVKRNLPSLKEKYANVNVTYAHNIPNVQGMEDQISQLVSIIEKIKEKMRQFGVDDTDNSIKKWDLAIQSLNSTVANALRRNKEAGDKLVDLKDKLWSNGTMYSSTESLADVKARFDNYNKTLDEISAASHTIKIKLADLNAEASGVIGQLLERDSILTTTPATTTPSGPPDWLTFQSTATGIIGKDPGFATCAVEDLTQWDMMKITRVNKDGREEAIAAWKLGVGARKAVRDRRIKVKRTKTATGGKMTVGIQTLQCEDEGTYYCSIDSYNMWPLESSIGVISPPEDDLKPEFPTEVFEDKVANFSCMGHPGYPNGRIIWKIKREKEVEFRPFEFYSSRPKVTDTSCVRTETNTVEYQFDLQWNNTKVRCYIENTDFYAEGIIRLLPYDICNKVRYQGTISHPYTPHKYIVCGKELNIMQCPGNTCYDQKEENCVRCKAGSVGSDPCLGQPLYSYVAHETDCKKYYICMGPTKTAKKCTKGYFAPNIPGNCVMSYAQSHCGRKAG